jgi:hypothetical protein
VWKIWAQDNVSDASVQTLPLNRTRQPHSCTAWGLPRAQWWTLWALNTFKKAWNMLRLSVHRMLYEYRSSAGCWRYITFRWLVSIEDDHLENDLRSTSNGTDVIDYHEVFREPSVEIIPILVLYRVRSTALFPHLQLCHIHWLVSVQSWATYIHVCFRCYTACLTGPVLYSSKHVTVCMTSARITHRVFPCSSISKGIRNTEN